VDTREAEENRWFAEEVYLHEPALRAYLRSRFPAMHDQDDLVQETYARLIRAKAIGKVRNLKAYLFAMGRNAAFDLFRRDKVISIGGIAEIERLPVLEDCRDSSDVSDHDQELEILREAIGSLPLRCRAVVTLRKIEGLTYREISERLEISENTVNAQLAIGALRLRDFFRARGFLKGRCHANEAR
jgi:RNA polymerase sigma-70 factor (ECF subfamily)